MASGDIERLISYFSRLPGMGARSAERIVLHLLQRKFTVMDAFMNAMKDVYDNVKVCETCFNIDISSPCGICKNYKRDDSVLTIVSDVSDLRSIERAKFYSGKYHVLGDKLSAINGVTPDDLNIDSLINRLGNSDKIKEVIMAMSADLDGQTTMFYISDKIKDFDIKITTLSHGVPIGSDIGYLDDGTIIAAFNQRRDV